MSSEAGSSEEYNEAHFHSLSPLKNICFEAVLTNIQTLVLLTLSHITSATDGSWDPPGAKTRCMV